MLNTTLLKMYNGSIAHFLRDLNYVRTVCPTADELYTSAAVILARRSGKTMVGGLVSTCIILSMPRGNSLCYTMSHRQAKTWFTSAYSYMQLLKDDPEFGWRIERIEDGRTLRITKTGTMGGGTNQQTGLLVYGNCLDERSAQNLRGTGAEAILAQLDEGLFFADGAYIVVLPIIANGCGFIITSSQPPLNTNALGLLEAKDKNGNPLMKVISMRRQCLSCEHREKRTQQEVNCQHVAQRPLSFRSRSDEDRLEAYLKPFGDAYATEMLNKRTADTSALFFDQASISDAFMEPGHRIARLSTPVHWFLTSMDPSGHENGPSETAITTVCFTRVVPSGQYINENISSPSQLHCVVRLSLLNLFFFFFFFGHGKRGGRAAGEPRVP